MLPIIVPIFLKINAYKYKIKVIKINMGR